MLVACRIVCVWVLAYLALESHGQELYDQSGFAKWFSNLETSLPAQDAHSILNQALRIDIDSFKRNSEPPSSLTNFSKTLSSTFPNCPGWIVKTIRDAKIVAPMALSIDLPKVEHLKSDGYFVQKSPHQKDKHERQLLGRILADLMPMDFEPKGPQRFITTGYSKDSQVMCRFVYTDDNASRYVVGCDRIGIRWTQRSWSKIDWASTGEPPKNVATIWTESNFAMLVVISECSISLEGFDFDSGAVVVRLNTDLSWGKSP